jgi:tetratricopeptide (TPR) repeat protein
LALLALALAIWLWPGKAPPSPDTAHYDDEDLDQLMEVVNPGYVGIEACAKCHSARAAEFKTSRHYIACTTAEGVKAPGFEPGLGRYDTRAPGLHFEMARSGGKFTITSVQAADRGETRRSHEVGLVYGSGNGRDEMYFAWNGDQLIHLPVAWLYPQKRWGNAVDPTHTTLTPPSCLECHNTWVAHVPGTPNQYRRDDMLLGVTCERCHGPGREHVEYHRKHPKAAAHAILYPRRLSRERKIDLCAQCHGNTRLLGRPFSYRPGTPIEGPYRTARAKYREDDTTTNQVQYLSESKCFQKSEMTCRTCHNPHVPVSARDGCQKCHKKPDSCTDQKRQPEAVRGDCVGCHMPQHIWMNSHYYTTTDDLYLPIAPRSEHRIAVYPEAKQAVELAWYRKQTDTKSRAEAARLAAQLSDFWMKAGERRYRAGRFKAAIGAYREALQVAPSPKASQHLQEAIRRQTEVDGLYEKLENGASPQEAIQLLTRALKLAPNDARAHAELGMVYARGGLGNEAAAHLKAVARCDPYNASGLARLAWLANSQGRYEEAAKLCAEVETVDSGQPENYLVWGHALAKLGHWADAEKQFRATLRANLAHGEANKGLSEALRRQGKAEEAVRFGRRAVYFCDTRDVEALITLAEAYDAAGRVPDARKTFERALALAQAAGSPHARTILNRLRELQ